MSCCAFEGDHRLQPVRSGICGLLGTILLAIPALSKENSDYSSAERLVQQAWQAHLEGNAPRRFALLRDAVRIAPEYKPARWQLGQVQVDGQWLAVEEAQRRAAADPRQAEYRAGREATDESAQGQLALARWCRKNKLDEEGRFHWASVLSIDPDNEEAQRAIDMRWQDGRLLTREEIAQQKERLKESRRAAKQWSPKIARWRRDVSSADAAKRDMALDEIRALTTTDVIPAIEAVTLGRDAVRKSSSGECRQICLAFLEALAKMPEYAATESLVRHAVFSPVEDARTAAIQYLKPRPQQEYVPLLLSVLAMPVESSFQVRSVPDGSVHYTHSLYREGPDADWSHDFRRSVVQHDLGSLLYTYDVYTKKQDVSRSPQAAVAAAVKTANIARTYEDRFARRAVATELQICQLNQVIEAMNALAIGVLTAATGQDLGDSPWAWWDWWQNHNEYYASDHPVHSQYDSDTDAYYHGRPISRVIDTSPPPPPTPGRLSCFAKGTLVWTKTGQRPIEELELGDLVLAQDVDTGELKYQPVIARTVRPPSGLLRISCDGETLRTTPGHPIWVVGAGWRMAKEFDDGAILHGVTGSPRVAAVEPDGEEEAYNLVVAEFNTYFVGETGLLVHDNSPRRPTLATVPGFSAK